MTVFTRFLMVTAAAAAVWAADLGRGRELYTQGDYDKAAGELRGVVEASGDNAEAQRLLGLALIEQGKTDEGATHIRRAAELEPGGASNLALARLYAEQKDWDKAEQSLKDASGDDLEYVRGIVNLNRKRNKEAAEDLEAALEKNPKRAYAHYYAGLAYNGLRRPDKMMTHFEHFLRMKPDAPEARKVRAVMKTGR